MPQDPSTLDPKYKNVLEEFPYQHMKAVKAPAGHTAEKLADHKEPLHSPMGVGKAWKPKGRK